MGESESLEDLQRGPFGNHRNIGSRLELGRKGKVKSIVWEPPRHVSMKVDAKLVALPKERKAIKSVKDRTMTPNKEARKNPGQVWSEKPWESGKSG